MDSVKNGNRMPSSEKLYSITVYNIINGIFSLILLNPSIPNEAHSSKLAPHIAEVGPVVERVRVVGRSHQCFIGHIRLLLLHRRLYMGRLRWRFRGSGGREWSGGYVARFQCCPVPQFLPRRVK